MLIRHSISYFAKFFNGFENTDKFNYKEPDLSLLPDTKGKRESGYRFYKIDGKN